MPVWDVADRIPPGADMVIADAAHCGERLRRRLGTPGLSVRKPVDDLCKHPKNLCATWG